jgi:hypothetical protein
MIMMMITGGGSGVVGSSSSSGGGGGGSISISSSSILLLSVYAHTETRTPPCGKTHNQFDHLLINRRRNSFIHDVRSFMGADCGTDLVFAKVRE